MFIGQYVYWPVCLFPFKEGCFVCLYFILNFGLFIFMFYFWLIILGYIYVWKCSINVFWGEKFWYVIPLTRRNMLRVINKRIYKQFYLWEVSCPSDIQKLPSICENLGFISVLPQPTSKRYIGRYDSIPFLIITLHPLNIHFNNILLSTSVPSP
jgi:hypothetical protein